MTHKLKVLIPYFVAIENHDKNFELRLNDRNYQVGDNVILEEWTGQCYTTRTAVRSIKYVLKDCPQFGLKDGYCIFGW